LSDEKSRLQDYLDHIETAILRISHYLDGIDFAHFQKDTLLQDAVVRNLEIIGEASRNIERKFPDFCISNPKLPFRNAYEMRNVLAHGYFKLDLDIVWRTITNELPAFLNEIRHLRQ